MPELVEISKRITPRNPATTPQRIPRIIWQTMKSNMVPPIMKAYADSWINLNPEYEYRFFADGDVVAFIQEEFPHFLEGYNNIKYGASKADLWRYLVLYKYGGVYADIDCKCHQPMNNWVDPQAAFTTQIGINRDICQWLIMSEPGNPIFLRAAEQALENIRLKKYSAKYVGFKLQGDRLVLCDKVEPYEVYHEVMGLAGPPVLQEAAEKALISGELNHIWSEVQVVCVSKGNISCQMAGNVSHDTGNEEYLKGLKTLKTPYYDNFMARWLRKLFPPKKK